MLAEEAPSTSCSEEAPLVHEKPNGARTVWKIAAAAGLMALVAAASTSWARHGSISEKTASLSAAYHAHATIGCSNWNQIQKSSTVVADKAACAAACTADADCTGFNWQADACPQGWEGAAPSTCLVYAGDCVTERNVCWEMNYRETATTSVSTTLTVDAGAPARRLAGSDAVGREMHDAFAGLEELMKAMEATLVKEGGLEGVTVEPYNMLHGVRRLGLLSFLVKFVSQIEEEATKAFEYFVGLAEDEDENKKFVTALKDAVPASVTINGDTCNATVPTVEKTGEEARPDCATAAEDCRAAACCEEPGLFCYEKDEHWAGCRPSCNIGIHEHDPPAFQTPWTCEVIDTSPDAPPPIPAASTTEAEAPAPPACADAVSNCVVSKCCQDEGLFCYAKSAYWASCRPDCNIGIYEHDVAPSNTPWTCEVLDEDPSAPEPTAEATTS